MKIHLVALFQRLDQIKTGLTLAFASSILSVSAQFTGKLVYEKDNKDSKLIMTYFQNGTKGRVEAYTLSPGKENTITNRQDTILFDFAAGHEIHLSNHAGRSLAIVTKYTLVIMDEVLSKQTQVTTVQVLGQETINKYACTHYLLNHTMGGRSSNQKDIWITRDIKGIPAVYVMGAYLYFTPGYAQFTKLTEAGGNGVVVRTHDRTSGATMDLLSADFSTPSSSLLAIPGKYTIVDNSNRSVPSR
ncbi:MAG: hypothetical protein C5B59_02180 [Bacteroidetes bacterium]|nr:MAG: hypothetical protein C5B59_02180 [Bacteroidota bacterium]